MLADKLVFFMQSQGFFLCGTVYFFATDLTLVTGSNNWTTEYILILLFSSFNLQPLWDNAPGLNRCGKLVSIS